MADADAPLPIIKKRGNRTGIRRRTSDDATAAAPSLDHAGADGDDSSNANIEDLLALRAYRQAQRKSGTDVLQVGDDRERKRQRVDAPEEEAPQLGLRVMRGSTSGSKADDDANAPRNIFRTTNFTTQSNGLAVDKHMMSYIETELAKRKGGGQVDTQKELAKLDPHDELYQIAERYQVKQGEREGNVTLSTAMLTAIPEVDLGIESVRIEDWEGIDSCVHSNRLKNIEDTEKAKRLLYEATQAAKSHKPPEDGGFAAGRFFLADKQKQEVADIMALARAQAEKEEREDEVPKVHIEGADRPGRQRASDGAVMARFKQRERDRKPQKR